MLARATGVNWQSFEIFLLFLAQLLHLCFSCYLQLSGNPCWSFVINSKILEKISLWLLDYLTNSTTLVCGSEEFKEWSKYIERLNQVWVLSNKENEPAEWPTVSFMVIFLFLIWSLYMTASRAFRSVQCLADTP